MGRRWRQQKGRLTIGVIVVIVICICQLFIQVEIAYSTMP